MKIQTNEKSKFRSQKQNKNRSVVPSSMGVSSDDQKLDHKALNEMQNGMSGRKLISGPSGILNHAERRDLRKKCTEF